jgi:hypothetical protein
VLVAGVAALSGVAAPAGAAGRPAVAATATVSNAVKSALERAEWGRMQPNQAGNRPAL